jgi:beta-ketoacyl-acyl-carrier-protein synthase II
MAYRVVITGMGTVNPVGQSVAETWDGLCAGRSGVGPITQFDASDLQVRIAGEVKHWAPEQFMDAKEARRRDRFQQFASASAKQAIDQAGLLNQVAGDRVAVVVSSAIGGLNTIETGFRTLREQGQRKVSPFYIPMMMSNGAASLVGMDYGFRGPSFSVASACASGSDAIGLAGRLVRDGLADAAIAGASEATITLFGVLPFDRTGALSRRNEDYHTTPAPFDKNRHGLVMAEGAAILVLERLEHAQARGAPILAELAGHGATADAFHITAPAEHGEGGAAAIRLALADAGVSAGQVDYINAHGTGTELNDLAETEAIKGALGEAAYRIPTSSTKSMTGHMMGATAALEAIVCVQAIRTQRVPPTIHYETPDPACDLDYVPNVAREVKVEMALSNAFGFGGHNSVLAIRRFAG